MAEVGRGLVAFVGVEPSDTAETAKEAAELLESLRIFEGEAGHLDRRLREVEGDLLLVPNFTICASFSSGGRPSFDGAASPDSAEKLYDVLLEETTERFASPKSGQFGADMDVTVRNDGPVTVTLDV